MTRGSGLRTAIRAVVGLCLAVAVGLAANAISRDSIGLAPTPAGSDVRLAPAKSPSTADQPTRKASPTNKNGTANPKRSTGTTTTTPTPSAPTTTSGGDDRGDDDDGGNRGSGSSGSNSGSGGSGGSGSSGHGGGDDDD
jgi:uncharacterized membrane protein YgcG